MTDVRIVDKPSPDEGWFVVWTAPRAEKQVEGRIAATGLPSWLPKVIERRLWSDWWTQAVRPLFPGYLFARGGLAHLSPLLRTLGVVTVVKSGAGRHAFLADDFIASLQSAIEARGVHASAVEEEVRYHVDDEVIIRGRPVGRVAKHRAGSPQRPASHGLDRTDRPRRGLRDRPRAGGAAIRLATRASRPSRAQAAWGQATAMTEDLYR